MSSVVAAKPICTRIGSVVLDTPNSEPSAFPNLIEATGVAVLSEDAAP